jgi:Putative zinc-finger
MNMHDNMRDLLNAYLDGELHGTRLLEMKKHLAACETCREELKDLRLVSDLLLAAPAPEFTPAERFVSNLTLSLPRRTLRDRPPKPGSLAWWLVPAGLMFAWFFVRTVITLTDVVSAANATGLLGNAFQWLGSGHETAWFAVATNLFGGQTSSMLSALNSLNILGIDLLKGFLWQALIALLYWGWLALWWFRRGPRPVNGPANPLRP